MSSVIGGLQLGEAFAEGIGEELVAVVLQGHHTFHNVLTVLDARERERESERDKNNNNPCRLVD